MKYVIEVAGQSFIVEVRCGTLEGVATINGSSVDFALSEPEPGVYTLLVANRVLEVRTVGNSTQGSVEISSESSFTSPSRSGK